MPRKEAKTLLPAITHFANGGELWCYIPTSDRWLQQVNVCLGKGCDISNIIKDKHFEASKADALGEEVEILINKYTNEWQIVTHPQWGTHREYRPKPKEVYEWQWYRKSPAGVYVLTSNFFSEPLDNREYTKFKPSKRLRKDKK